MARPDDHSPTPANPAAAAPATSALPAKVAAKNKAAGRAWVPIRSLSRHHRGRITEHLLALSERDRYLRFGYPATNDQLTRYVDTLDFDRDELFGIFNRRLELIAQAHLAYAPVPLHPEQPAMAEFGVSVQTDARGRGYGGRLFQHAMLHARNRGMQTLFIHALSENTAMLKIARKAGATVERDGAETEAWLKLPPETIGSRFDEVLGLHAAELDYQFKLQARRVSGLLDGISEVKGQFDGHQRTASE